MGLICFGIFYGERFQGPKNPGPGPGLISEGKAFQNRPPQPLPAIPFTRPIVLENTATLAALAALAAACAWVGSSHWARGIFVWLSGRACD